MDDSRDLFSRVSVAVFGDESFSAYIDKDVILLLPETEISPGFDYSASQ